MPATMSVLAICRCPWQQLKAVRSGVDRRKPVARGVTQEAVDAPKTGVWSYAYLLLGLCSRVCSIGNVSRRIGSDSTSEGRGSSNVATQRSSSLEHSLLRPGKDSSSHMRGDSRVFPKRFSTGQCPEARGSGTVQADLFRNEMCDLRTDRLSIGRPFPVAICHSSSRRSI
jgi:hypothetical protein